MNDHKRFYPTKLLSIDEEKHQIWARFTDDQPDREGEIMDGMTWDFEDWMKAPTVLFGHKDWELPIGRGLEIRKGTETNSKGESVIFHDALIEFDVDDEESARVWGKVARGFLKTLSVGYVTRRREGNRLLDNLLTEISFVPVPANINALTRSLGDGSLSQKDAEWMRDHAAATVKSLTEYIETGDNKKSVSAIKGKGAKSMNDDDLKKVADMITAGVTEAVKPLVDQVTDLSTKVETLSKAKTEEKVDPKDDPNAKPPKDGSTEGISDDEADEILAQVDAMLSDPDDSNDES